MYEFHGGTQRFVVVKGSTDDGHQFIELVVAEDFGKVNKRRLGYLDDHKTVGIICDDSGRSRWTFDNHELRCFDKPEFCVSQDMEHWGFPNGSDFVNSRFFQPLYLKEKVSPSIAGQKWSLIKTSDIWKTKVQQIRIGIGYNLSPLNEFTYCAQNVEGVVQVQVEMDLNERAEFSFIKKGSKFLIQVNSGQYLSLNGQSLVASDQGTFTDYWNRPTACHFELKPTGPGFLIVTEIKNKRYYLSVKDKQVVTVENEDQALPFLIREAGLFKDVVDWYITRTRIDYNIHDTIDAFPSIGCMMLTYNRPGREKTLENAINSFLQQNYENKTLVILDNGKQEQHSCEQQKSEKSVRSIIRYCLSKLDKLSLEPTIIYSYAQNKEKNIGLMRKIALNICKDHGCEYFAIWDDDDLFHQNRLYIMMSYILKHNAIACFLNRCIVYTDTYAVIGTFLNNAGATPQTMVCKITDQFNYNEMPVGEDSDFIARLRQHYGDKLITIDCPLLYGYYIHGNNSYDSEHYNTMFRMRSCDLTMRTMKDIVSMKVSLERAKPVHGRHCVLGAAQDRNGFFVVSHVLNLEYYHLEYIEGSVVLRTYHGTYIDVDKNGHLQQVTKPTDGSLFTFEKMRSGTEEFVVAKTTLGDQYLTIDQTGKGVQALPNTSINHNRASD